MKKLLLVLLVVVLVTGLVFTSCAAPAPAPVPKPAPTPTPTPTPVAKPIKIGLIYPQTGPAAQIGQFMVLASKFGFEEVGYEIAVER